MDRTGKVLVVFVGDRRSRAAIRMGVTWYDGRLAAKTLAEVLDAVGLSYDDYDVVNAYHDDGGLDVSILHFLKRLQARGRAIVIGMGKQAQEALTALDIPHREMVHPAARGRIRRRDRYQAHVGEVLAGCYGEDKGINRKEKDAHDAAAKDESA